MSQSLKIAIISDLHCRQGSDLDITNVKTYLTTDLPQNPVERNPVEALKKTLKKRQISVDLVLCPGDITDKANTQGLVSGFKYLQEIKNFLNAEFLFSTVGNHDVDSRNLNKFEHPFELVKRLHDDYPTFDGTMNSNFWGNDFCFYSNERWQLLVFNSSFNHLDEKRSEFSSISPKTLSDIETILSNESNTKLPKIAMCHHHPIKHSNMDYKDGDSIDKGDRLLDLLEKYDFSLVVHGHKHDPRVSYHSSIPVFCAGSFSSIMNIMDISAQNTFHIVEILPNKMGKIESWTYGPKAGWTQPAETYFPIITGFGARPNIINLTENCVKWLNDQSTDYVKYSDLLKAIPEVEYLIPTEQIALQSNLIAQEWEIMPSITAGGKRILKMVNE